MNTPVSFHEQSDQGIQKYLKGISIPTRPDAITDLRREMGRPLPDLRRISSTIGRDIALSAGILKTVNSPFYGLTSKLSSVEQAVNFMGLETVSKIVTGLLLRNIFPANNLFMERFWYYTEQTARISAYFANTLHIIPPGDAQTFVLFQNIGVPMLMQKFGNYEQMESEAAAEDMNIIDCENEVYSSNHASLGYIMAKGWYLSSELCEAILRHHDVSVFDVLDPISPTARSLVAIGAISDRMNRELMGLAETKEWKQMASHVRLHLGITEQDYRDMKSNVIIMMEDDHD
jgi:HD-like signal output (HDOD) protein